MPNDIQSLLALPRGLSMFQDVANGPIWEHFNKIKDFSRRSSHALWQGVRRWCLQAQTSLSFSYSCHVSSTWFLHWMLCDGVQTSNLQINIPFRTDMIMMLPISVFIVTESCEDSSCFPRIWWKSKHGQVRWRDLQAAMMQFLELCRVKPCSYLARLCDGLLQWKGSTLHSITGWNFSCWSIPACVPAPCLILVQPCWAASFSASCVSHVEIRKKICFFGRQNRILNALDDIKLIHRVLASRVNRRDAFSLVSRGPKRLDPSIKGMKQRTDREAAGGPLGRSSPNFTVFEQKRDLIDKTTLL